MHPIALASAAIGARSRRKHGARQTGNDLAYLGRRGNSCYARMRATFSGSESPGKEDPGVMSRVEFQTPIPTEADAIPEPVNGGAQAGQGEGEEVDGGHGT